MKAKLKQQRQDEQRRMNESTEHQESTNHPLLSAVLPCQVYYPADKRNVELKEIKGDKAIIRLKFAGYWHNYDKEVLLSELIPIPEHKHDIDSFNGHCQVCGKYCR